MMSAIPMLWLQAEAAIGKHIMQQDEALEKRIQERVSVSEDEIISLDIILEDGGSISHVGIKEREFIIYGCRTMIGCIGWVATSSDYRERGLATRLMKRAGQKINDDNGDVMLVSGDRDLYRRRGCVPAAVTNKFIISRADAEKLDTSDIQLVPYSEDSLLDIANIYQKEPVRFHRHLAEFRALLKEWAPAPLWTGTDVYMLSDSGESLSYVVTQEPRDEDGGNGRLAIAEYGGSRKTVINSIKALFARHDVEELQFFVAEHDLEFLHILKQQDFEGVKGSLEGHTLKIINLPRLMDRLASYIQERVGREIAGSLKFAQDGDKSKIIYKHESMELDGESLPVLIFGTHDEAEKEIISSAKSMTSIFQALFPLPFVWPGLNSY